MIEFRFRLSERNKPGAEMEPVPRPISLAIEDSEQPQVTHDPRIQRAQELEAELAQLKAT